MPTLADLLKTQRPSMVGMVGNSQPIRTLANTIQGYAPPQMTAFTNPQVIDYAKGVGQSAQQNLQTQISDLNKALVMGDKGVEIGDKIALTRLLDQIPGLMGAVAYHGTPHTIRGKFDISKVGTGEGAQAYGHGMYFAENPAVAKQYALTIPKTVDSEAYSAENIAKRLYQGGFDENYITKRLKLFYPKAKEEVITNALESAKTGKVGGNVYKVDIPDEYIPNMLDWDKPLTQQSSEVRKALAQYMEGSDTFISPVKGSLYDPTGKQIYEAITKDTDAFSGKGSKIASEQLNQLGIKGIRYLDAGSRPNNIVDKRLEDLYQKYSGDIEKAADDFMRTVHNTPKEKAKIRETIVKLLEDRPTSNFVVFEPSQVKILEQNSKPYDPLEAFIKGSSD